MSELPASVLTMPQQTTYREIKADILRKITQGEWKPGASIPNELDLAASYGVARATVNRAMRELAEEGIIERKRKAGSKVRMSPLRRARFDIPLVRREIEDQGAVYRYALISSVVERAPDWLRARLQLGAATEVLHLVCMHFADGSPYQFEDRWINLDLLPQARDADFSELGPNEWLIAAVPFSDAEISFSAAAADRSLADHLSCSPGDPLFQLERSTWWQDKAVTYVRLFYRPGHRMTTRY
jgi:GntR family histidine utilization transcriptional repressor